MKYLTETRTTLVYNIPLAEVVTDYFDNLKSRSKGYASMEYKITGYRWEQYFLFSFCPPPLPPHTRACARSRLPHSQVSASQPADQSLHWGWDGPNACAGGSCAV